MSVAGELIVLPVSVPVRTPDGARIQSGALRESATWTHRIHRMPQPPGKDAFTYARNARVLHDEPVGSSINLYI